MSSRFHMLANCNYPSDTRPAHQVFVRALLLEMASLGIDISVIAPETLWNIVKKRTGFRLAPSFEERDGLPIHRPRHLTYSKVSLPFIGSTSKWGYNAYIQSVLREVRNMGGAFDVCYGHFLYPHGAATAQLGTLLGIPSVVSLGESSFARYESTYTRSEIGQLLNTFSGVIANSTLIKENCVETYGLDENKIRVYPNGVDNAHFYPRNREEARKYCQLPLDRPIIIFVGQFIERKGPNRVLESIKSRPEIGAVFLGYGPQTPGGPQVLYQGEVSHEDVPVWLSAADFFVMPTLNEGCSNSILEALSCGLPVVSSKLPFNQDIIDEEVAILVDPQDIRELEGAISTLVDAEELRGTMGQAAIEKSQSFRLVERAKRIKVYIQELI